MGANVVSACGYGRIGAHWMRTWTRRLRGISNSASKASRSTSWTATTSRWWTSTTACAAKAAEHKLLVDLHGAYHPTGLIRTYPNYLTQEGVLGAEYNKWTTRITATHNLTLPFTRMLLGPMDYTPGGFRNVRPAAFKPQHIAPQVMTTRAQQLAMYVVYESPFAVVSDSPEQYENVPAAQFLRDVPASWDETRAIEGAIGEHIVLARRSGKDWYVGAMTNEQARTLQVPLTFLDKGTWTATIYADGAAPTEVNIETRKLTRNDTLQLQLAASGGAAIRLHKK